MLWAIRDGTRQLASPRSRAQCPSCRGEVLAKCGSIVSHHWAHVANDCDPWSEPESEWHREWKNRFSDDEQEVVIGPHRADVRTLRGVIELQASPISPEEIRKREDFYGQLWGYPSMGTMDWILRGMDFQKHLEFHKQSDLVNGWTHSMTWKHPRKSWWYAKKTIFIDLGNGTLFEIEPALSFGHGRFVPIERYLQWHDPD